MSFMTHFSSEKVPQHSFEEKKEIAQVEQELLGYKKKFMETFYNSLTCHEKMDQQILVLILMTIQQNYNNENERKILSEYVEKGILAKVLKLKMQNGSNYTNFYQNKFKSVVTVDEAVRMFIFKLFVDEKSHENLLEGIFKFVMGYYNDKNNEIEINELLNLASEYINIDTSLFRKVVDKMFQVIEKEEKKGEDDDEDEDDEEDDDDNEEDEEEEKEEKEEKEESKKKSE